MIALREHVSLALHMLIHPRVIWICPVLFQDQIIQSLIIVQLILMAQLNNSPRWRIAILTFLPIVHTITWNALTKEPVTENLAIAIVMMDTMVHN